MLAVFIWIFLHFLTLSVIFLISYFVSSYLSGKPLGRQTLFDLLLADVLKVIPLGLTMISSGILNFKIFKTSVLVVSFKNICRPFYSIESRVNLNSK